MDSVQVKVEQTGEQIKIEPADAMESEEFSTSLQAIWSNNADVAFQKKTAKDLRENEMLDIVTRNIVNDNNIKMESNHQQFSSQEEHIASVSQVENDTHGCSTSNWNSKRYTLIKQRTCPNCSYVAPKISDLKIHMLVHSDELFQCTKCDKSYQSKLTLDSHILSYHKNDDSKAVVTHKIQKCSECDFKASGMKKLEWHYLRVHEGYTIYKKHKCEYCDYRSSSKTRISRHELKHTGVKLFNCQFCKSGYNMRHRLEEHIVRNHKHQCDNIQEMISRKILKCEKCPFQTVTPSALNLHAVKHGAEFAKDLEPFKCYHCAYQTYVKKGLAVHVLKHLSTKQFSCSECDRGFTNKLSLDFHVMKVHATDKPELVNTVTRKLYRCGGCAGIFKYLIDMQKHKCTQ